MQIPAFSKLFAHFRAIVSLLTLFVALTGCQHADSTGETAKSESPAAPPREVVVTEVSNEVWPLTIRVQGSLLGDETAVIGARVAGRVDNVIVDLGSVVKKGDLLVELDRREFATRVQQAQAQLQQACAAINLSPDEDETKVRREQAAPVVLEQALVDEARAALSRAQSLPSRQAISASEIERLTALLKTAEARHRSALNSVGEQIALIGVRRAELQLAKQQWEDAQIVAPFDGVIEQRRVAPGEYVQVGQAVATLVRIDKLRFTAGVPESKAALVRAKRDDADAGQTVRIYVPGDSQPEEAIISRVSPMVAQSSRAVWIEADVPNPSRRWQAGMFAEAEIVVDPYATALTVPASAITEFAGIEKVWVVRKGQAEEKQVRTGRRDGDRVEILPYAEIAEPLTSGDLIVIDSRQGHAGSVIAVRDPSVSGQHAAVPAQSAE
jgi:RND family efflux transporter MFP subunit